MPLFDFKQLVETANSVEDRPKFTILDNGDYDFIIKELPEVNDEKQYLKVKAVVASGPRENYTHYHYVTLRQDAAPFALKQAVRFLNACGLTDDQIAKANSLEDFANYLTGKRFVATVTTKPNTYNGETKDQNNIGDFRPSTGAPLGGPSGVGGPTPNVSGPSPSQTPQTGNNVPQADPWANATPPAQNQPGPTTQFQAPPMPFGNNG